MTVEEKRKLIEDGLKEAQSREYVAWVNWQATNAVVERLIVLLAELD